MQYAHHMHHKLEVNNNLTKNKTEVNEANSNTTKEGKLGRNISKLGKRRKFLHSIMSKR